MLSPETRHLLTDALKPPAGHVLDVAVATTYSLNLNSLLIAPLAMAAHDAVSMSGDTSPDPVAVLESVKRHAEFTVFCQAGGPSPSQASTANSSPSSRTRSSRSCLQPKDDSSTPRCGSSASPTGRAASTTGSSASAATSPMTGPGTPSYGSTRPPGTPIRD